MALEAKPSPGPITLSCDPPDLGAQDRPSLWATASLGYVVRCRGPSSGHFGW